MKPLVYLDSQDYSNLASQPTLLEELVALKNAGQARFVYSSAIISECAPTSSDATRNALDRSHVITELCGKTTFISIDQIISKEFRSLDHAPLSRSELISESGDWFPAVDSLLSDLDRAAIMKETIQEKDLNRKQRRAITSIAMRNGDLRKSTSDAMIESDDTFEEIVSTYPMHPDNARVLLSFVAGKVSKKRAERALLESLRDHHWMMQWFHQHNDRLSFVPSFIRKPSANLLDRLGNTVALSKNVESPTSNWHDIIEKIIVQLGQDQARDFQVRSIVSPERIHKHCPGFVTVLRTIREIAKDSMGTSNRRLKSSDFADAIHAMHAPYVDIYRTDTYMAGKISLSNGAETTVCPKLRALPDIITQWEPRP